MKRHSKFPNNIYVLDLETHKSLFVEQQVYLREDFVELAGQTLAAEDNRPDKEE